MALMGSPVINSGFDDLVDQIVGHGGSPKEKTPTSYTDRGLGSRK
jgi:hypothetical protein